MSTTDEDNEGQRAHVANVVDFKKPMPHFSDLPTKEIVTLYNLSFIEDRKLKYLRQRDPERTAQMEASFIEMLGATIDARVADLPKVDGSR